MAIFGRTRIRKGRFVPQVCALTAFLCVAWHFGGADMDTAVQTGVGRQLLEVPTNVTNDTSVDLFGYDLFTQEEQRSGAIILHFFCMLYMFAGLAIICDEYFVPALEVLCEVLKMKDDVAGATFMAAGGSAPELATSVLSTFVTRGDLGFGTIVGSAVFNVLFVIGGCAFIATGVPLTWWPLARDCSYYAFAILMCVVCVVNQVVEWYESVILLCGYLGYVTIMYFNEDLEEFVRKGLEASKAINDSNRPKWRQQCLNFIEFLPMVAFIYIVIIVSVATVFFPADNQPAEIINYVCIGIFLVELLIKWCAYTVFGYFRDGMNAFDFVLVVLMLLELFMGVVGTGDGEQKILRVVRFLRFCRTVRLLRLIRLLAKEKRDVATQWIQGDWEQDYHRAVPVSVKGESIAWPSHPVENGAPEEKVALTTQNPLTPEEDTTSPPTKEVEGEDESEDESEDDDDPPNPFEIPDTWKGRLWWACTLPLSLLIFLTVPHCKRPIFRRFFFVTFFLSVLWIGILSYVMVWMATLIGKALKIPDAVMGVTILAAGTSVPDLLESLAVAKRGQGDMAVSSSIGSNVFDLLLGLPLPWLLGTIYYQESVKIESKGLVLSVLTLFLMVGATIGTIVFEGWRLTRRLGYIMLGLYLLFVAESLLLEYEVIGFTD